jgi:Tfp pilus assembly protein PilO
MDEKKAKTDYKQVVLEQLRQPLKLRLVLCAAIIAGWYVLFFSPLSEQVDSTKSKITRERKRAATASQVEKLKKAMVPYQGRIPAGAHVNDLMQHVNAQIRLSPLKLLDLMPEKAKDLGPYETLGLKLTLEGRFTEIDEFLRWVETGQRLLRIDTIKLDPDIKDPARLKAQVILLSLVEKSAPTAKANPEADKKK